MRAPPTPAKADQAIQTLYHDLRFRAQVQKAWPDAGGSPKDLEHAGATDRSAGVR